MSIETDNSTFRRSHPVLRGTAVAMVMSLASCGAAGCSRQSSEKYDESGSTSGQVTVNTCYKSGQWDHVPKGINLKGWAQVLRLRVLALEGGSYGPVTCTEAITRNDIANHTPADILKIKDMSRLCLAYAQNPMDGGSSEASRSALAICPVSFAEPNDA